MGKRIVFNVTKMGASHVKSGKPCQDYSISWQSEDKTISVAIVCDGHGGDTYVRSDVGSKLAAKIALENIRNFVTSVSPANFIDIAGAVTARPENEDDHFFGGSQKKNPQDMTDSELQQHEQNQAFYAAVANIREQDELFTRLFASIYLEWLAEIEQDARENPFTDVEKAHLKNAKLVKAYGSTLMAYVRTPLYWFAFHIGDGKLLCCDRNLSWREPVPWDCNCFLNMTTSLCNSNPIPAFRYAFSGKGDFPSAVFMGSDGIDDSWGNMTNLQNFYSQILSLFNESGEEKTIEELEKDLPVLSERGSRDDMSVAGVIDLDDIKDGVEVYVTQRKLRALKSEKDAQEAELTKLQAQKVQTESDIKTLSAAIKTIEQENESWFQRVLADKSQRENNVEQKKAELKQCEDAIAQCNQQYEAKYTAYQTWMATATKEKEALMDEVEKLKKQNETKMQEEIESWKLMKASFERKYQQAADAEIQARSSYMEACNDEALQALENLDKPAEGQEQ